MYRSSTSIMYFLARGLPFFVMRAITSASWRRSKGGPVRRG